MPRVLVVEDEVLLRKTTVDVLTFGGYETLEAADGYTGMHLTREHLPDLVISDVMMPNFDGYELLKALRTDPRTSAIPVVFLSALNDSKDIRHGMNEGADDYLGKPFSADELLRVVGTQLKKKTLIQDKYDTSLKLLRKNIIYALPHELRTPLSIILGYGQILETDYQTVSPDDLLQWAQAIVGAGQRLQRVIENYLVYAQIEVIQGDAAEVEQLRNHLVRDAASVIENVARALAVQYERETDLSLDLCRLALRISEANLKKIVEELVDNAFKFSSPGSKVLVKSVRDEDIFKLYVRDHGRGMTPEQVTALGAYMQFDRALLEQQGLGLGFTLAHRLVELHNGKLNIESRPQQGTLVSIEWSVY